MVKTMGFCSVPVILSFSNNVDYSLLRLRLTLADIFSDPFPRSVQ